MKNRYTAGVLVAVLLWGISYIWIKGVLDYLSPMMIVTIRVIIAMFVIFTFAVITKKLQGITKKDALIFFGVACADPVAYFLFESFGVMHVTPTLASVIISIIPLVAPIAAAGINGEMVSKNIFIGLGVSLVGVMLVIFSDGFADLGGRFIGVLFLLGAVAVAVLYMIVVQRLSKRYNSYSIVAWQNVFAAMIMIPLAFVFERESFAALEFSWYWASRILMLGALCSGVAFVFYADGIRELGVTKTSLLINLQPSVTAVASYFLIGESLGVMKICGILITISGLFIGGRKER